MPDTSKKERENRRRRRKAETEGIENEGKEVELEEVLGDCPIMRRDSTGYMP